MQQSEDQFETAMTYIVNHELKEKLRKVFIEHQVPKDYPTHEWVQKCIRSSLLSLRRILKERGEEYGVDVLFDGGQTGVVELARTKLGRVSGAIKVGADPTDSWIDLAGYAMLGLVINTWESR